ncbi:unnamed protein product [Rhizophagus irregularis]|nr:unnamed protein product [Rhizophagus irregularis]
MKITNRTFEFRLPDENYEPDFGIMLPDELYNPKINFRFSLIDTILHIKVTNKNPELLKLSDIANQSNKFKSLDYV